ncbi:MAG: hypothetical protein RR446_01625 [Lachnospiraceae bacterium]
MNMRKIQIAFVVTVCLLLSLLIVNFNTQEKAISEIDNRELATLSLDKTDGFQKTVKKIDNYMNDRIGFRSEGIRGYATYNDVMFHEMVHPTYTYGKDDYVFFKLAPEVVDTEFVNAFCEYLRKVQDYCNERGVPFIYCINPAKTTVYSQYLPNGYHYQDLLLKELYRQLEHDGVNYISNVELLKEKSKTEQVFNVQYDAGHWNDLGAFYGTNHILEKISQYFPNVHPNQQSDFDITTQVETKLPASEFQIREQVPVFQNKREGNIISKQADYEGLWLNEHYPEKDYLVNQEGEGLPRTLVFQGSYLNSRRRFLESNFSEYYSIHNYENFLYLDYYFNAFQPECVVLETTEYALNAAYFSYKAVEGKRFNTEADFAQSQRIPLESVKHTSEVKGNWVTIIIPAMDDVKGGEVQFGDRRFDFQYDGEGNYFTCTIDKKYQIDGGMCRFY